ncbi:nicotinamide riboside transporter PnuC [Cellulosimicrobium sp. Marseille-Q8652]
MSVEEILGFVTGAACVWLAVRQNVWTFPVGLANNVVFLVLFTGTGLYANAGLQVVYLVLGALGWYWWLRGGPGRGALVVHRTPRAAWVVGIVAAAVCTAVLVAVLTAWTDSTVPFWDALTTSSSLLAQTMLGRKWIGNWWVWIATDVVLVGLYASQGLWLTAVLYVGFVALCVQGLREWSAARRETVPEVAAEVRPGPGVAVVPDDAGSAG